MESERTNKKKNGDNKRSRRRDSSSTEAATAVEEEEEEGKVQFNLTNYSIRFPPRCQSPTSFSKSHHKGGEAWKSDDVSRRTSDQRLVGSSLASSCGSNDHLLAFRSLRDPKRSGTTSSTTVASVHASQQQRTVTSSTHGDSNEDDARRAELNERLNLPHQVTDNTDPWVPVHNAKSSTSTKSSDEVNTPPPPLSPTDTISDDVVTVRSGTSASSKEHESASAPSMSPSSLSSSSLPGSDAERPTPTNPPSQQQQQQPQDQQQEDGQQQQQEERTMTDEERNDMELLTRPSWCDAGFALKRVLQGKATGNVLALQIRAHMHSWLYRLGLFVHRQAFMIAFISFLILGACSVGLRQASMEVDIQKLWVESGGVLEQELEYTNQIKNKYNQNVDSDEGGYTFQIMVQTSEGDIQTTKSMKTHARVAIEAANTKVSMFNQTWTFEDLCFKPPFVLASNDPSVNNVINDAFDNIIPCFIISPLDCFWEGSKLLGPSTPFTLPFSMNLNWKNFNPMKLLAQFRDSGVRQSSDGKETLDLIKRYQDAFEKAGISDGYQSRYCLDPHDPECPTTAPNYESKDEAPVRELLSAGCTGFATDLQKWPKDLIVSPPQSGKTESQALQTLFHLMSAENVYNYYKETLKVGKGWDSEKAQDILHAWQRRFIERVHDSEVTSEPEMVSTDKLYAFNEATVVDIISEFSKISLYRILGGYFLMLAYAYITLRKATASKSQGGVAMAGVVLIAISVSGGLGFSSLVGIKFNAASAQVLPFLLLGLGVDDMFLLACNFAEISLLSYLPIEERTGECLKRVGVSILLTSIAILSAFLCSMIIPMPALRAFSMQAAIVTIFNLVTILISFPALLSLDLQRRHENRVDMFCCLKSTAENSVIDLSYKNMPQPLPVCYYNGRDDQVVMQTTYNNDSYNNYIGSPIILDHHPRTPPPEYTEDAGTAPPRPRVAFEENLHSNVITIPSNNNSDQQQQQQVGVTPEYGQTPMESVRSSTRSLVPNRNGLTSLLRKRYDLIWRRLTGCIAAVPNMSIARLAERYYGPFLLRREIQAFVLCVAFGAVTYAVYECTRVRDGLDLVDVIPRGTRQHGAVQVQQKYFSFYPMYIISKDFDYANQQKTLMSLHEEISSIKYVIKQTGGESQLFWLHYFRRWLQKLQESFDADWIQGYVNEKTWTPDATDDTVIAWKLLVQTGNVKQPTDQSRIGCLDRTKRCEKVDITRLVGDDGQIPVDAFYNYLTAWYNADPFAYITSQASLIPAPPHWYFKRDANLIIPRSPDIVYAQMPYFLNGLSENEDFVSVIQQVRQACNSREKSGDFGAYPTGYPFLFWQQYIDLRYWLFIAIGCVLGTIFIVLSIILMNPFTSFLMTAVLAIILTELYGYMGAAGVKLSAMPAVIIVAAVGIGLEFIVHLTLAFITTCGKRKFRVVSSLSQTMAPIMDGAISTLLGVVMLAGAEFDFIVKYFFQVLVVLIVLGVFNGLVLLPVLLYRYGPVSEVEPKEENMNRISTPTPPPTLRSGSRNNNNNQPFPRNRRTNAIPGPYHQTAPASRYPTSGVHMPPPSLAGVGDVYDYVRRDLHVASRTGWVRHPQSRGIDDEAVWRHHHHPNAVMPRTTPEAYGVYVYQPDYMMASQRPTPSSQIDYIRPPTLHSHAQWNADPLYPPGPGAAAALHPPPPSVAAAAASHPPGAAAASFEAVHHPHHHQHHHRWYQQHHPHVVSRNIRHLASANSIIPPSSGDHELGGEQILPPYHYPPTQQHQQQEHRDSREEHPTAAAPTVSASLHRPRFDISALADVTSSQPR